ncbi:hypothetical protein D3C85_1090510 [compost metagenome]
MLADLKTFPKSVNNVYFEITSSKAVLAIAKSATVVVGAAPSVLTLADHKYTSAFSICVAPRDH